jgi:ferritin-like metal-binding protein YciE
MSSCRNAAFHPAFEPGFLPISRPPGVPSSRSFDLLRHRLFPSQVSAICWNDTAIGWLALISATGQIGAPATTPAPFCPRNKRTRPMGLFSKDIKTLNDLFLHQLQDIYYAEKQLVKALPKMAEKATDKQLKQGFLTHLDETKTHVRRLEQVFKMHGGEVMAVDCPAIDGIIEEADEVTGEVADKPVLDAALINAAQAAEHYEITRYGSLIAWAKQLGRADCASLLQKTLDEERATDKKLTALAEGSVNLRAAS